MNRSDMTFITLGILLIIALGTATWYQVRPADAGADAEDRIRYEKGLKYFQMERYAEALSEFNAIKHADDTNWKLLYYRGSTLIKLGEFEEATHDLEHAFSINPDESTIPFATGVAYYKLGELGLAKGYFSATLKIDPSNEDARGLMDIMTDLERQQPGKRPAPPSAHGGNDGT
jgi:Flp pilus assembly protein TadD